jgi:hypothetical protein
MSAYLNGYENSFLTAVTWDDFTAATEPIQWYCAMYYVITTVSLGHHECCHSCLLAPTWQCCWWCCNAGSQQPAWAVLKDKWHGYPVPAWSVFE